MNYMNLKKSRIVCSALIVMFIVIPLLVSVDQVNSIESSYHAVDNDIGTLIDEDGDYRFDIAGDFPLIPMRIICIGWIMDIGPPIVGYIITLTTIMMRIQMAGYETRLD